MTDFLQALGPGDEEPGFVPNDLGHHVVAAGDPLTWDSGWVASAAQDLELPAAAIPELESTWASLRVSAGLTGFFRSARDRLFLGAPAPLPPSNPVPDLLPTLILLSAYPALVRYCDAHQISPAVRRATLGLLGRSLEESQGETGHWLLPEFQWILGFFLARGFCLGRLQFIPRTNPKPFLVFRHRRTSRVTLLSAPGIVYRKDGLVDGTNGRFDTDGGQTSELVCTPGEAWGLAFEESGIAGPGLVCLEDAAWDPVYRPGDPWLDLHIPGEGPLDEALVEGSFLQAREFFGELYPDQRFSIVVCESWLLDPQLQDFLEPTSNVVRFQMRGHLYPVLSDDRQTFENLFQADPADLAQVPEKTRLQRRVAAHVRAGHPMRMGGAVYLLPEPEGEDR